MTAELKHCISIERRWNRYKVSRESPDIELITLTANCFATKIRSVAVKLANNASRFYGESSIIEVNDRFCFGESPITDAVNAASL